MTDAHVVLGTLDPTASSAAACRSTAPPPRRVERAVAEPLGLAVEAAAAAVLRIANANMANALRVMSIARGHDPRRFALVAIGGAGPMHACALADELGIPRVVVPRYPGVTAALGLLATDIRHDLRRSWLVPTARARRRERVDAELASWRPRAGGCWSAASAVADAFELTYELDMRYRGQAYNLTVPLEPRPVTAATLAVAELAFAAEHERLYDYTPSVTETEIVTLRLRAVARDARARLGVAASPRSPPPATQPRRVRRPWSRVDGAAARRAAAQGDVIGSRTIVEQEDATVAVPAGWRGRVGAGRHARAAAGGRRMSAHSTRHPGDPRAAASTTSPRRWRSSSTARPTRRSSARCSTSTAASSPQTAAWSRTPSRSRRSSG